MRIASHRPMYVLLFLAVALLPLQTVAFEIPPNDGFVTDAAGILSPEEEQRLESLLSAYQAETTNEIAVVIVETTEGEPLMETAVEIGRLWGVGTKENDNGIILLISYADREMFLATGYGLEGAVPDIVAKGVIEREVTPRFRDGEFAAGIEAGVLPDLPQIFRCQLPSSSASSFLHSSLQSSRGYSSRSRPPVRGGQGESWGCSLASSSREPVDGGGAFPSS